MRHTRLITMGAFLLMVTSGFFLTHCKKFEVSRKIIVKTEGVSEITISSCKVAGSLLDQGSTGATEHGFCWSLTSNPAEAIDCNTLGAKNDKGAFSTIVEDLAPGTAYYFWAYAEDSEERSYGEAMNFTTLTAAVPTVETGSVRNMTSTAAECEYNIVSDGGSPVTERGLCWGTSPAPSVEGTHKGFGSGTGMYSGTMDGLTPDTDYFVRAYAINSVGVAYGNQVTFATKAEGTVPTVHTEAVENILSSSALIKGSITSDGGEEITQKGFCWNTEPNPTADNNIIQAGSGPAAFEATITGLTPGTLYYVRAYAENAAGINYGEDLEFTTPPAPLVDDRNDKTYQTVQIGDQVWMAENLNIGTKINGSLDGSDNGTIEKYCYQNNDAFCEQYGAMYNWDEMMQYNYSESSQGVCPDGWHIPSDEEWKIMEMTLGMSREEADGVDYRGIDQGGKLKATGVELWDGPNEGATNESGFNALPAGGMDNTGVFSSEGFFTDFWTSSWDGTNPWYRLLDADHASIFRTQGNKGFATSVRCMKD